MILIIKNMILIITKNVAKLYFENANKIIQFKKFNV